MWFGRDILGRKSLLVARDGKKGCFFLSSVGFANEEKKFIFAEIPANNLFHLNLNDELNFLTLQFLTLPESDISCLPFQVKYFLIAY